MKAKDIETMPVNQELLALIAPQGIEIKSNRVQMGEFLSKIQYISGYPSRVNIGWLLSLKDIPNTIVSLVITPIEDVQGFVEGVSKGITTDKNMEILIHIGIDTVKFGGKPFKQFVEKGQRVKQGDLLIEFDKELLKQGDADLTTMVVITNSNDYLEIIPTKEKRVKMNDDLLTVI